MQVPRARPLARQVRGVFSAAHAQSWYKKALALPVCKSRLKALKGTGTPRTKAESLEVQPGHSSKSPFGGLLEGIGYGKDLLVLEWFPDKL